MNISLPIKDIEKFKINDCVSVEQLLLDMNSKVKNEKFIEAITYFKKFIQDLKNSRPFIKKIDY